MRAMERVPRLEQGSQLLYFSQTQQKIASPQESARIRLQNHQRPLYLAKERHQTPRFLKRHQPRKEREHHPISLQPFIRLKLNQMKSLRLRLAGKALENLVL